MAETLTAPYLSLLDTEPGLFPLFLDRQRGYLWKLGYTGPMLWKIRAEDGTILFAGRGPDVPAEEDADSWQIEYGGVSQTTGHVYVSDASGTLPRLRCLDGTDLHLVATSPDLNATIRDIIMHDPWVDVLTQSSTATITRTWLTRLPLALDTIVWQVLLATVPRANPPTVPLLLDNSIPIDGDGMLWYAGRRTLYQIAPGDGAITPVDLSGSLPAQGNIIAAGYDPVSGSLALLADTGFIETAQMLRFALDTQTVDATVSNALWATSQNNAYFPYHWTRLPQGRVWLRLYHAGASDQGAFMEFDVPTMTPVRTYELTADWGIVDGALTSDALTAAWRSGAYLWDDCACALWLYNDWSGAYPTVEVPAGTYGIWKLTLPDAPAADCPSGVCAMTVTPGTSLASSGPPGGPFLPPTGTYTVTNAGEGSLLWTAAPSVAWASVAPNTGTLAADGSMTVTVSLLAGADDLPGGFHAGLITFANTVNGLGNTTRLVELTVRPGMPDAMPLPCEPLPTFLAYGATGGPEYAVSLFTSPGGWEQRTQHWPQVRGRWDISFVNRTAAEMATLVAFFRAVAQGRANAFCFTDWLDHTFDNQIGLGDGVTTTYQLVKVYTSGTLTYARKLTRPVAATLGVQMNGVTTTAYTLDPLRGLVVFGSPPPGGAIITAQGEFEVLVRFEQDALQMSCVAPGLFSAAQLGLLEVVGE